MQQKCVENLSYFLENIIEVFHLTLYHSKPNIGAPLLQYFTHRAREEIRNSSKYFPEEYQKDLKLIYDYMKECYELFSRGNKIGAETYFYHLESIVENCKQILLSSIKSEI
jgi:hypothetical protein